jgi:type VI secretion system protein ImpJ
MYCTNRPLWGEGMFLRPQHFQQQAQFLETSLAQAMHLSRAYPWGVRKIDLDSDALLGGLLRINNINVVYQDGTMVNAPNADPLPEVRSLNDIPQVGTETLVYACLPALNAFGGNSAESTSKASRPPRFLIVESPISDLYTTALEAEVLTLHTNVRILVAQEDRSGHYAIPVARIHKNASGVWVIDSSFIPPLIELSGSARMELLIRRLLDIMLVKSQALATSHRERVKSVVEYGTSDIASFWLLHTINRAFPLLNHYSNTTTPPEALYKLLSQFCGELLTFSSTLSLNDIPRYDHENLTATFGRIDAMIRELLETVVSTRYAIIPLVNSKPSFFIGRLDSERLVENVDYYLSVSGEMTTTEVIERVPTKLKIGSPDDVEKILNSALPGVHLSHATQTPTALPVRVGNHYFALEPQGLIFDHMLKSRSVCIYVPQALLELNLELIAVFR